MRASLSLLLVICAASLSVPPRLDAQQPSGCRSPAPLHDLRSRIERWISSDDSLDVTFRRNYKLPQLPPDSVVVVTDVALCQRAARVYYREHLGPLPLDGVELFRVGDIYVAWAPARGSNHWSALSFYTRDFVLLSGMLY